MNDAGRNENRPAAPGGGSAGASIVERVKPKRGAKVKTLAALGKLHDGIWYFSEHALVAGATPKVPKLRSMPGLLFTHSVQDDEGWKTLSYWSSREAFDASEPALRGQLELGRLIRRGFLCQPEIRKTPFWKKLTPAGVLLQVVALLGAFAALETYGAWLFERPQLTVELDQDAELDLLAGVALDTKARVFNLCRRERLVVEEAEAWLASDSGGERIPLTAKLMSPTVEQGQSSLLRLSGGPLTPGIYRIVTSLRATAGLLRGDRAVEQMPGSIEVWARGASIELTAGEEGGDGFRWFDGLLQAGEALSPAAECQLTLDTDRLRFGLLIFPGILESRRVHLPDLRLAQVTWRFGEQERFYRERFRIPIESDDVETDWTSVAQRIESRCAPLPKGEGG